MIILILSRVGQGCDGGRAGGGGESGRRIENTESIIITVGRWYVVWHVRMMKGEVLWIFHDTKFYVQERRPLMQNNMISN